MKNGKTIHQLFMEHIYSLDYRERFPFAVRQIGHAKSYYVIVERFDINSNYGSKVFGVPMKDGKLSRIWFGYDVWREDLTIPGYGNAMWEYASDIDLSYYRRGSPVPFELHHVLQWGKYQGLSLEEICQVQPSYIKWAIETIDKTFCLSSTSIEELKVMGIEFSSEVLALNEQKVKWYLSDYADEFKPEAIKLQDAEHALRLRQIEEDPF